MPKSNRRVTRAVRGSTRNESCGIGGNEPPEKPRLKTCIETTPVRKPKFNKNVPKPVEHRPLDPSRVREAKAPGMSLKAESLALKSLQDFNLATFTLFSGD